MGQDDLTVVLNEEGICTQKCALNWTDIPVAMGESTIASLSHFGPPSKSGAPFTALADSGFQCHLLSVPLLVSRKVF